MAEDTGISALVASRALEVSGAIYKAFVGKFLKPADLDSYRAAHEIAAKLHLIATYLGSVPPYWVEPDVEQLCHTMLRSLDAIYSLTAGPPYLSTFSHTSTDLKTKLMRFFKKKTETSQEIKRDCDSLIQTLTKDGNDIKGVPKTATQGADTLDTSLDELNHGVFNALQSIAECESTEYETCRTAPTAEDLEIMRHPARLCLHELRNSQETAGRDMTVLVSAMDMTFWQEFSLKIFSQPSSPADDGQLLSRGGFCYILDRQIDASVPLYFKDGKGLFRLNQSQVLRQFYKGGNGESLKEVLCHYNLTPKDKVTLSYAIARSYWKYCNSELLIRTQWTDDNIWFMPEGGNEGNKEHLPLCAYLSFPFSIPGRTDSDIVDRDELTHKYPQILEIGVLLLEIGLAKPFQTLKRKNRVSQANFDHGRAIKDLGELEKMKWDGSKISKGYFDDAVKFCLQSKDVNPSPKQQNPDGKEGIIIRKRFHENVVRPLEWLATKGFETQVGHINYVNKKSPSLLNRAPDDEARELEADAEFHSATAVPQMWLRDLKQISELVERKRRKCAVSVKICVAILDTGLDRELPTFGTKSGLLKSIIEEKDFVDPDAKPMTDTFGHGTLMARLLMECAPGADIMVARVARNTNELESSRENIKKAILWAGQIGKADIIFMSFGFSKNDQGIREAIEKVQRERQDNIIFLASAGNSSTDNESFPARHHAVISVYATNRNGGFLQSNAKTTSNSAAVLGTFGDDIPSSLQDEFSSTYPKICEPGSSVATAIMAGISATILIYAAVLPGLISQPDTMLQRLRTTKGMEAALDRLAPKDEDHPRRRAVNPIWFWKESSDDFKRYVAIYDTLSKVDRIS
ncbi:hypothetical protein HDV64DRAFT_267387 [Trichoderma sp. TUCIM 5745]